MKNSTSSRSEKGENENVLSAESRLKAQNLAEEDEDWSPEVVIPMFEQNASMRMNQDPTMDILLTGTAGERVHHQGSEDKL